MKRLLLSTLLCLISFSVLPATAGAAATSPTAKYVVLIVLDAGRPDYITRNLGSMPNLRALLQHARTYDRAWVGDLMSITPPSHAVIGTGSFPKDDGGIVNWDWGVHSTGKISPTFQAKPNYLNGWAFKVIKDSGTPTLAGVIHSKYPHGLAVAGSGAHFHAAGPMGGPDANWIFSYDRINGNWAPYTLSPGRPVPAALLNDPSLRARLATSNNSTLPLVYDPLPLGEQDSLVMRFGARTVQRYRPRALMLNLPEPDTVGHWSSKWYPEERRLYLQFDRDLGGLIAAYKRAGIYSKTLFVITADHGMIQFHNRVIDRTAIANQLKNQLHVGTILLNGGGKGGPTMTSIWLKDSSQNQRVAQALWNHHYDNVSAIYYMTNTNGQYAYKTAGCESCSPDLQKTYAYLLSTEAGPSGEDIAILLRENTGNSGLPIMHGRHGGADWGSQHITLIMSGPGVKPGASHHPARIVDLAPTIERFMGITPKARDGLVLADAFQNPNPSDVAAQTQSDLTQNVYVNALTQRAQSDLKLEAEGKIPNAVVPGNAGTRTQYHWPVAPGGVFILLAGLIALSFALKEAYRQRSGLRRVD